MTTLAAIKPRRYEMGDRNDVPMIADDVVWEGAAVGLSSGTARPLQAGDPFLGFAEATADNAGGAAGAIYCRVRRFGVTVLPVVGVDGWDDVGKAVYASDDDTFTLTAGTNTQIGHVIGHESATRCRVAFEGVSGVVAGLTDNSGGTASDTLAAVGASYSQAVMANAIASLAAKVNALIARLGG